jgi:DnaJ-class molecular chaperone
MQELEYEMRFFNKGRENLLALIRNKNFFERFNTSVDVDLKTLKQKYKSITLRWHPDMINKLGFIFANRTRYCSFMSEVFMLYKDAYQVLADDKERKKYASLLNTSNPANFKR